MKRKRAPGEAAPRPRGRSDAHAANGHAPPPARPPTGPAVVAPDGKVIALATRPERDARTTAALAANRCVKCQSTFVMREPAFLHCYYCGAMTRIPSGSLLEQELFEVRSGLRLAS